METIKFEIEMQSGKKMVGELYPEIAPITVKNFVGLIEQNFYDGLIFHRVIPGFMIQGGGMNAIREMKHCPSIIGEFASNGIENNLLHTPGVLSMARAYHPDSAGSQFFIMVGKAPHLDGQYAAFGKITSNINVCLDIAEVKTNVRDMPLAPVIIKSIEIIED